MSNEVVKKEASPVAAANTQRRGFEESYDRGDLQIPRAILLQPTSPQLDGNDALKPGMLINNITLEALPDTFIPLFKFTNWIRFNPRDVKDPNFDKDFAPGAIIWRSNDPLDPKVKVEASFGDNGEKPLATKFLNFFAYFPGVDMPIVIGFAKTSAKAGKQLLSLAAFTSGDMFSRKYKLTTKKVQNEKGTYFVLNVAPAGKVADAEYVQAEEWWKIFHEKAKDIQIHEDGAAEDEETPF